MPERPHGLAIAEVDPRAPGVAERLLPVQRAAYAVEAALIGSDAIPALTGTADDLRRCGERILEARDPHGTAGAVGWRRDGGLVDIHRLVVHPRAHRRGVATALLDALESAERDASAWVVRTGAANAPALALYARRGFTVACEEEPVPGLRVAVLHRGTASDR